MKYITHKRFRKTAICGWMNLPAGTELNCEGGALIYHNDIICYADSDTGHKFFCRNDDGRGMERGRLTRAIVTALARQDDRHQERWDKIWADSVCQPYKRADYEDYWLWNHEFYNADVEDLRHIAQLVGVKEGK